MSKIKYKQLVERLLQNVAQPTRYTDTGIEAAQQIGQIATQEEIEWAIAGGLAMHLYGSPCYTKDVDIIASRRLSLTLEHSLTIGGSSYTLNVGRYQIQIDWIVHKDGFATFYRAALTEAITIKSNDRPHGD